MNGKLITKEQIDALEKYLVPIATKTGNSWFIALDDLREIYDNAQDVGGKAVAEVLKDTNNFKYINWFEPWEYVLNYGNRLYTTPQPNHVAELEATIKSYNEFLGSGKPKEYRDKIAELEAKLKEYEADAKRYQKLKSLMGDVIADIAVSYFAGVDWHTVRDAETLDSLLDQAMKGKQHDNTRA